MMWGQLWRPLSIKAHLGSAAQELEPVTQLSKVRNADSSAQSHFLCAVKILKFGTPQTIAIIVVRIEKFDETLH